MNTPQYEVILKVRRLTAWADASGNPQIKRDLRAIERAMLAQSEEIRALKISRHALRTGQCVPTANSSMVAGTAQEQAEAICAAEFPVDVYRFPSGAITWRKRGTKGARGGEFIGSYDEGADCRRVCEDLAA